MQVKQIKLNLDEQVAKVLEQDAKVLGMKFNAYVQIILGQYAKAKSKEDLGE